MKRVAALLAAASLVTGLAACGGDGGAEPGASEDASLMLDFQPNAVHAGIYAALDGGYYRRAGIRLRVRIPSESTDAPRLLASGRTDFAVLDIHDLALARQAGIDVVGIAALVQRPLASVIARGVRRPRDLEGRRAGVTGLPSDDAVLDSVVGADGGDPSRVRRVTIGFDAVKALRAERVAAATGFWNAEGLELKRTRTPVRIFKVDAFGAPPYPELVLATSRRLLRREPGLARGMAHATSKGIERARRRPRDAVDALVTHNKGLDRGRQRAALAAISPILSPAGRLDLAVLRQWAAWEVRHGIVERRPDVAMAFPRVPDGG